MNEKLIDMIKHTTNYTTEPYEVKCKNCVNYVQRDDTDKLWCSYCDNGRLGLMPVAPDGRCDNFEAEL